jgi:hypothetical protein
VVSAGLKGCYNNSCLQIRTIREKAVMCTVQACGRVARHVFTGAIDTNSGRPALVAAYCGLHAAQEAKRLGQQAGGPKLRAQSA